MSESPGVPFNNKNIFFFKLWITFWHFGTEKHSHSYIICSFFNHYFAQPISNSYCISSFIVLYRFDCGMHIFLRWKIYYKTIKHQMVWVWVGMIWLFLWQFWRKNVQVFISKQFSRYDIYFFYLLPFLLHIKIHVFILYTRKCCNKMPFWCFIYTYTYQNLYITIIISYIHKQNKYTS